jgi:hypothetical protein
MTLVKYIANQRYNTDIAIKEWMVIGIACLLAKSALRVQSRYLSMGYISKGVPSTL